MLILLRTVCFFVINYCKNIVQGIIMRILTFSINFSPLYGGKQYQTSKVRNKMNGNTLRVINVIKKMC